LLQLAGTISSKWRSTISGVIICCGSVAISVKVVSLTVKATTPMPSAAARNSLPPLLTPEACASSLRTSMVMMVAPRITAATPIKKKPRFSALILISLEQLGIFDAT
jgi:hypothetical protein